MIKEKLQAWVRRSKARSWFIDPSKVAFGSVVEQGHRNVSRTHVRVKYQGESSAHFMPFHTFVLRCQASIVAGQSLKIEHLLVAPILKRRHASYFDVLTDWDPATQRARTSIPES